MRAGTLVGLAFFLLLPVQVFGKCASHDYAARGKVTDTFGKPIVGARVKIEWFSEAFRGSLHLRSDARGRINGTIWFYPWESKPAIADWCNGKLREVTVSVVAPRFQPSHSVINVGDRNVEINLTLQPIGVPTANARIP
jgi:hypothetical protein